MELADRVLEVLYDRADAFVALSELAAELQVKPRQLDHALHKLHRGGFETEFSPSQGVRLNRPVPLNAHLIEQRDLGTRRVGASVICFEEVDSTNNVAFDSARQGGTDGLVVLAEFQRKGRGRMGRQWLSPAGQNVLLSALLLDPAEQLCHEALTIAAGLSVAEGISAALGLECQLKWPNDVLLDNKKVAGVLVEVRQTDGVRCAIVGIGINANAAPPEGETELPASDLSDHLGHPVERIELIRAVLRRLDFWVGRIEQSDVSELSSTWMSRCGLRNRRVKVLCGGDEHVGRVLDVSPLEGLAIVCDDGRSIHLPAASSTVLELDAPRPRQQNE